MARTGRPRSFDRDEAIQQAMHLFWRHGYESTSLSVLTAAIGGGITPPSFYAAFGSKEALFREVVERYVETHGQATAPLFDQTLFPREAVETTLRQSARMQTDGSHPSGCLLVMSASACSAENRHLEEMLAKERTRTAIGFRQCVQRAVDAGELHPDTNVGALSGVFQTFLLGITPQARDGVAVGLFDAMINQIMAIWDGCAKTSHKR